MLYKTKSQIRNELLLMITMFGPFTYKNIIEYMEFKYDDACPIDILEELVKKDQIICSKIDDKVVTIVSNT